MLKYLFLFLHGQVRNCDNGKYGVRHSFTVLCLLLAGFPDCLFRISTHVRASSCIPDTVGRLHFSVCGSVRSPKPERGSCSPLHSTSTFSEKSGVIMNLLTFVSSPVGAGLSKNPFLICEKTRFNSIFDAAIPVTNVATHPLHRLGPGMAIALTRGSLPATPGR